MKKQINILKKDGIILGKDTVLDKLNAAFDIISNGEYTISISKAVKQRTYPQNKLFWLWATCIERETGTDKNDVHDYYCMLFLRRTAQINGEDRVIISGTSKLNTEQFTDFLNKVQSDAASEFGIKLPKREDAYFESFEQEYKRYINI
ncbi:MAG: hypothetical protein LBM08_04795 [Dysgonamonadaceae bacterium]|jgi:hypothetical protein|nr:hypothetical protein [Dysgonamonadaceae bacterium]